MSTRANIVLTETFSWKEKGKEKSVTKKLFFYRHSDGYPEGTLPTLNIFMDWLKRGVIRNNLGQSAGWLIIIGAMECESIPNVKVTDKGMISQKTDIVDPEDWKVGAYEPTTGIHGDIEWLYTIDLTKKELTYSHV